MSDLTAQLALIAHGAGVKHGRKPAAQLPMAETNFLQLLSARLGRAVADGDAAVAGGKAVDAVLKAAGGLESASPETAPKDAALARAAGTEAAADAPAWPPVDGQAALALAAASVDDMPAAGTARPDGAMPSTMSGASAIDGETAKRTPPNPGEGAAMDTPQADAKAARGAASQATSAAQGQALPAMDAFARAVHAVRDDGVAAPAQGIDAADGRGAAADSARGAAATGGAALLVSSSGAKDLAAGLAPSGIEGAQADPAVSRPFDQLLRAQEVKVNVAVEAPVRSTAFPAELGEKVVWLAGRQGQWAEISINPPSLGTVEVRLSMSSGEAGAQFYSPNPEVREAIEAALPKLRELLAEVGINLGRASVRDEGFAQRDGTERQARDGGHGEATPEGAPQPSGESPVRTARAGVGLVDLYI